MVTRYEDRPSASQASSPLKRQDFTWVQDSVGNPYIGTVLTTLDPATANLQTKTTQTVDVHGNVTPTAIYDFGNLTTAARTYNNTFVTASNYTSRYIFNRLISSAVSGSSNVTLVTNTYDGTALTNVTGQREHDATNYGTGFLYRGNVTKSVVPGATTNAAYNITGNAVSRDDGQGHVLALTVDSSTNFAAPTVMTPNGNSNLANSMAYSSFLALQQLTEPNNAQTRVTYDTYGRVATSTTKLGEVTTYAYTYNPTVVTGTVTSGSTSGIFTRTTMDGLGRPIKVETGDASSTKSVVDTVYGSCACSPLGKLTQVSQPHLPTMGAVYTTYTYDGLGRTATLVEPDGTSITTYTYSGNTTKITDPAGKWKTQTVDVFGNLTQMNEPNPGGGSDYVTTHTYDVLNHLTQVSMTRPTGTQTRTFTFDSNQRLWKVANPETQNGTVTYTYNSDGTLATKIDAKNQKVTYAYDAFQRIQTITRYPVSTGSPDPCETATFIWDVDPQILGESGVYPYGRLTAVAWGFQSDGVSPCTNGAFAEIFAYNQNGTVQAKRVQYSQLVSPGTVATGNLDGWFGYDSRGGITSVIYPNEWPTPGSQYYQYLNSEDTMARVIGVQYRQFNPNTNVWSTVTQWVNNASYGPANELTGMTLGGYTEARTVSVS